MVQIEPVAESMQHSWSWEEGDSPVDGAAPTPWDRALAGLERTHTYWLATVGPEGRPHAVPLLGVVVDGLVHFCAADRSRKARNLAASPGCVITAGIDTLDLVVEADATPLSDEATVGRVAEAYAAKYGWRPEVRDGALWGDGAPTAGPPPYRVYRVLPTTAFGFPTDDFSVPTRWRFGRNPRPSPAADPGSPPAHPR